MGFTFDSLFECFSQTLSTVLSEALMSPWRTEGCEGILSGDVVELRFEAIAPLTGNLFVRLRRTDAIKIADLFLGTDISATEWSTDRKEALDELMRQVVGRFQSAISSELGDVSFRLAANSAAGTTELRKRSYWAVSDAVKLQFEISVSPDLVGLQNQAHNVGATNANNPSAPDTHGNLELLNDVELAATLRFGQKRMFLREILELTSGSVIELDRQVNEPVDLMIDGKVVAWGELVVVDGSYGIRVTGVAAARRSGTERPTA